MGWASLWLLANSIVLSEDYRPALGVMNDGVRTSCGLHHLRFLTQPSLDQLGNCCRRGIDLQTNRRICSPEPMHLCVFFVDAQAEPAYINDEIVVGALLGDAKTKQLHPKRFRLVQVFGSECHEGVSVEHLCLQVKVSAESPSEVLEM
jgi:hypothetical protein